MSSEEGVTCLELLSRESSSSYRPIPTFIKSLDALLGNGIKPCSLTELVSVSGLGKTTLCLQLCMNVQIPHRLEGLESEALFIDTEKSFVPTRAREIAKYLTVHCKSIWPKCRLSVKRLMNGIHVIQCKDYSHLERVIISLDSYIKRHRKVRLIVIDSLSFPFYTKSDEFRSRSKPLYSIGQVLHYIAERYGIAVVVTNKLTTRFDNSEGDRRREHYVPFLGESWNHIPNQRINLYWGKNGRNRVADIVKSSYTQPASVNYKVTTAGIRE